MTDLSNHFTLDIQQITHGPDRNHFFGYIGHAQTIPWSHDGRYIVAMRTHFQDHMPGPGEIADIVLLDTANDYAVEKVDETTGWNPQQGTMLYWDPDPETCRFFFNDRDSKTGKIFTVLYDVSKRTRSREYRCEDTPFANSGVAQSGGWFCGLNYARMARLRRVTGYVGAWDWTEGVDHPEDDGIFKVDIESGRVEVLISFAQIAEAIAPTMDEPVTELFINHTLCNRSDDRIYFYARGGWDGNPGVKVNQPFTVSPDGSNLALQTIFVGGHPEWEAGDKNRLIGGKDGKLVLYDTDLQQIVGQIGTPDIIKGPGGDTALSPDGNWTVTGYGIDSHYNEWAVYRRTDGTWARTPRYDQRPYVKGDLRSDPGPLWNRHNTQVLFPSLVEDGSRQLHLIQIVQ
ncbi:hypothetical protein MK139_17485 [bacterium]|nr:hypothetical protein [bacterium]